MALPPISWTIDGLSTPLAGWSSTTTAFGGFGQMRGTIKEADARRIPSTVMQGSLVKGFTDGGSVVFEGRLSAPPAIRGGLATFAAQGESVRAVKRTNRLLYQSRDVSLWTDRANPPYSDTGSSPDLRVDVSPGALTWEFESGQAASAGEYHGVRFWAPGTQISRYAFRMLSTFTAANHVIRTHRFTGPNGSPTLVLDHPLALDTTVDAGTGAGEDGLNFEFILTSGSGTWTSNFIRLIDVRVNGNDLLTDSFTGSQVVADVGQRCGYDTSAVLTTSLNVLPLDWTSGSWAELLSYIATLEDRYWGVYEDGKLKYPAWGDREWTVYQADGATVDLTPLELYNQVTVKYVDVGGAPREVTVTASPDPLAATGIVNVWEESLADVQADSTLATQVAGNLLQRVSVQRYAGRIDCIKAIDSTGRDAPFEIRAGDTVRVADWDMNTAVTLRVFEVEYTPNGVSLGIEAGVSIASMLARAGLVGARAPSTAQLPELEPAGPAEPSGIPSEEQQHRERFLTWPQAFKRK